MQTRINYLDSSRGIAALIVLLAHFQLTTNAVSDWVFKTPLGILFDGDAAVLYFFILSGFVLSLSLKKMESLSVRNYIDFIWRRILRIFPAFIFTLLLTYLIVSTMNAETGTWLDRYWKVKPDLSSLFGQAILIKRFPNEPSLRLLPHDWTLTIEIAVSLLVPMLAFLSRKNPFLVLILIYCSIKFLGLDPFVFDFSLGVYIARIEPKLMKLNGRNSFKIILLIISVLLICSDYFAKPLMDFLDHLLIHHKAWGLAIILCLLLSSSRIQRILNFKPLIFLGKISYSFYLLHLVILLVMKNIFPTMNSGVFLIIFISLTTILATITYIQIEKPFMRLK